MAATGVNSNLFSVPVREAAECKRETLRKREMGVGNKVHRRGA